MKLSIFLAYKTILRGDKGSLALTIFILLSVFLNLLFIDSIFAGIARTMDNGRINYQYGEVIIEPKEGDEYIKNAREFIDKIKDYEHIKSITSRIRAGATLFYDKNNDGRDVAMFGGGGGVIGVDTEIDNDVLDIRSTVFEGRYLKKDEIGKAIIGADAAGGYGTSPFPFDLEGVKVGDKIDVQFKNGISREYEIVGIFKTRNFDVDSAVFVTKKDLNSILDSHGEASEIIVRLDDRNNSQKAIDFFKSVANVDYEMADWHEKLEFGRSINKSFDMIGNILRVIGSIVAGLVIFIIIFVDIINRRKQIGIMKAIGVPQMYIMLSYIIRGMFYTFTGMLFGYLIMKYGVISYFTINPIDFPMGWMVPVIKPESLKSSIVLFTIAGFIGSFLPTIREVRKKILELMK